MVVFPPCKINLGLAVIGRRNDGYHDLVTGFFPVPLTDMLEIIRSDEFAFSHSGLPVPGDEESNLVIRAYRLLQRDFNLPPVRIHLHKIIPMGAGLGGGSSDATYTLRVLNELFRLELGTGQLIDYAAFLGSDCPFFVFDQPMLGQGRGENLSPIPINLTSKILVIVVPPIHVSTAQAFAGIKPQRPARDMVEVLSGDIATWEQALHNDFEESVFRQFPEIAGCKKRLYDAGALYASMTGTGSGVYGCFTEEPKDIRKQFPGSAVWSIPIQ